jgi:hypothetical protein
MSDTNSFPTITDLPSYVVAADWTWDRPKPRSDPYHGCSSDWWIGTDNAGRRWVVKMRGSNYAYREHVFSALAQRLGIACQSSVYLVIPPKAPPLLNTINSESYQLALWFFEEHRRPCLQENCPLNLLSISLDTEADIEKYISCGVLNAIDRLNGEILGYLCGQHEPPGLLYTKSHEFIQVDNELMFSEDPVDLQNCEWLRFSIGKQCAATVCKKLSEIDDSELLNFSKVPQDYWVHDENEVPRRLIAAKRAAIAHLQGRLSKYFF